MMSDFIQNLRDYLYRANNLGYAKNSDLMYLVNSFNLKSMTQEDFLKYSIMAFFDGEKKFPEKNKGTSFDGKISAEEFNQVTKQRYEEFVDGMKKAYKANTQKEIEYHIPSYQELKYMLKNDSPYKEDLSKYKITIDEIVEPIKPNEKIGQSNQAFIGECYQDVSNFALAYSKKGSDLLNKSIKILSDGYEVTLYVAKPEKKTFVISKRELKDAQEEYITLDNGMTQKKYSYGDADIILLNLAIEKYRIGIGYKLRKEDTKSVKGFDDYLSGGLISQNLRLITGKTPYRIAYNDDNYKIMNSKNNFNLLERKSNSIKKVVNYLSKIGMENFAGGCTFKCVDRNWKTFGEKYDLHEAHSYSIKNIDVDKKIITICNPWHGKDAEIKIPYDEFIKYIESIQYIKL